MSFSFDKITSNLTEFVKGAKNPIGDILDPSNSRLSIAKLLKGGGKKTEKTPLTNIGFGIGPSKGEAVPLDKDWRVRVSVAKESGIFYHGDPGILAPLRETMGVVFPYTPTMTMSYSAGYSQHKPTHSNYPAYFYENSEIQAIQVQGDFTVQTRAEGQYLLACIYFFRSASKMFYGTGANRGNPPPLLFLNGYGNHILPNVPCVLTQFQHTMGADVDYIEIPSIINDPTISNMSGRSRPAGEVSQGKGAVNRLPTNSQIQITLQPVYSRNKVAEFDLNAFARGDLIKKGFL